MSERAAIEEWLPAVNAALIVISGSFLVAGYAFIRNRRITWHRRSMITATIFAALFLVVYVTRYIVFGSKIFPGEGVSRVLYFPVLIPHTIIAIPISPLPYITLRPGLPPPGPTPPPTPPL